MMELGDRRERCELRGRRCATPQFATARRWVSAVLSLRRWEVAVFFFANDGARAIGANAASYGVAVRNTPIRNGPRWPSPPCSLSVDGKSPCSFSPMMELGRSARTLRATGSRCASTADSQRPEDGSPPCSLSVISGWRDGVFFIPWRGVPTIPARRSSTGSGRLLAAFAGSFWRNRRVLFRQ